MKPHGPIWDEYVPLDLDGSVLTHKKDFKRATIVHCKHCELSLESPNAKRMQNHFDKNHGNGMQAVFCARVPFPPVGGDLMWQASLFKPGRAPTDRYPRVMQSDFLNFLNFL